MTLSTIFSASNQHRLALAAALLLAISSTSQAAETDSALLHKLKLATNEVSGFDNQYDAQVWLVASPMHWLGTMAAMANTGMPSGYWIPGTCIGASRQQLLPPLG